MQLYRGTRDIGLFRMLFILAVCFPMLVLFLHRYLVVTQYSYAIAGLVLLLVFMVHRSRKDYNFLSKLSYSSPEWMYYIEYIVFSLPFLILLIICKQYVPALLYVLLLLSVCFIIPSSKEAKSRLYTGVIRCIPAGMFEWQSGFRNTFPAIVLFYALGIVEIYQIWFAAVALILLAMIFISFYYGNESRQMLVASGQTPAKFLMYKLLRHVKYWILFLSPLFLLSFIHYEYWLYILIAFVAAINLLAFAILLKYAFYRPATVSGISSMIGTLAWLCSIILPFSVFVFAANIVLFVKATRNLNQYLSS